MKLPFLFSPLFTKLEIAKMFIFFWHFDNPRKCLLFLYIKCKTIDSPLPLSYVEGIRYQKEMIFQKRCFYCFFISSFFYILYKLYEIVFFSKHLIFYFSVTIKAILKSNPLEAIMKLLLSEHTIMQSEGLIALIMTAVNVHGKLIILLKNKEFLFANS